MAVLLVVSEALTFMQVFLTSREKIAKLIEFVAHAQQTPAGSDEEVFCQNYVRSTQVILISSDNLGENFAVDRSHGPAYSVVTGALADIFLLCRKFNHQKPSAVLCMILHEMIAVCRGEGDA